MMRSKIIPGFIFFISLLLVYYFHSNSVASYGPEKETISSPREITAFDSLIFEYDSLISDKIESAGTVGAALAIIHKGEIAFMKTYGVKKAGEKDPVDSHTAFRLASVSKSVTGILAGILAEEKIINLDDRVIDYLPGLRLKDSINTSSLSVRNLLSHTTGLVPHAYDNLVEANIPMSVIMDSLFRVNISAPPGLLYGYQNVMFSLYDTIAKVRTNKKFDELLTEKVFIPFGMIDASASFEAFRNNDNIAYPHTGARGRYRPLPLNDRYYNTLPAAGVNASISDMAKFLLALSDSDKSHSITRIVDTVLTPQIASPLKWVYFRKWDRVRSKRYALGWRIIDYKGKEIAYHGGYVQGYKSEIALCREEEIGIAYLSNSPNSAGSECIPEFLDMYFERHKTLGQVE
jgi:beta-lactamase class C